MVFFSISFSILFFSFPFFSSFFSLWWGIVISCQLPSWRTTTCGVSVTAYSVYLQLLSVPGDSFPITTSVSHSKRTEMRILPRRIFWWINTEQNLFHNGELWHLYSWCDVVRMIKWRIICLRLRATMEVKVKLSLYRPWRPLGLREVEAPTFSNIQHTDGGKVVSPMRRPLFTPRKIPGTYFC
jgi:hypothetical protein